MVRTKPDGLLFALPITAAPWVTSTFGIHKQSFTGRNAGGEEGRALELDGSGGGVAQLIGAAYRG